MDTRRKAHTGALNDHSTADSLVARPKLRPLGPEGPVGNTGPKGALKNLTMQPHSKRANPRQEGASKLNTVCGHVFWSATAYKSN